MSEKSLRPNPRPLGYIKPNAIKAILRGDTPNIKIGYEKTNKEEEHKINDVWIDADGKTWKQKDGYRERVGEFDDLRRELNPFFCPQCNKVLRGNADTKFMKIRNKCTNCVVEEDGKRILDGTMPKYEKLTMLNNAKDYFLDIKEQMTEYLKNMTDKQEYVNEDGSIEKWEGDLSESRKFMTSELEDVEKMLTKIDEEILKESNDAAN